MQNDQLEEIGHGHTNGTRPSALELSTSKPPGETRYPFYVNNPGISFKHNQNDLQFKFLTDSKEVDQSMHTDTDVCAIYFPPSLDLQHDDEIEVRLVEDLHAWPFFNCFRPALADAAISMSRFCSLESEMSFDRRILIHRHLAWIYLMDEVSERLPLYKLHTTAGKMYLENLKSITIGGPTKDIMQFKGSCPEELLRSAVDAQRILEEDLMPLKRKLFSPRHLQALIDSLLVYFDYQYEEGHKFGAEQPSQEILKTRSMTTGTIVAMILYISSTQADLCTADDACLIQLSLFVAIFNDITGLYKDLDSVEKKDDSSAYLNLVRVAMREEGYSDKDSLRFYVNKLNNLTRNFEFFLQTYSPLRREYYLYNLKICFNFHDYHLVGILGNPNNRYGWKQLRSD